MGLFNKNKKEKWTNLIGDLMQNGFRLSYNDELQQYGVYSASKNCKNKFEMKRPLEVYDYKDIVEFNVIVVDKERSRSGLGRAIGFGLLAGPSAAIVGAITAKNPKIVELTYVGITIKSITGDIYPLPILSTIGAKKIDSIAGKEALRKLKNSVDKLTETGAKFNEDLPDPNKVFKTSHDSTGKYSDIGLIKEEKIDLSIADELKKFKDLLDSGAITQEEYDFKKKELLDM